MFIYAMLWIPVLLFVGVYLCSWPRMATLRQVLCFDGTALLGFVGFCALVFWLLAHRHADPSVLSEERAWRLWLVAFWSGPLSVVWFSLAVTLRYFWFRPFSNPAVPNTALQVTAGGGGPSS